ncbi:MAG: hypothetical protein ACE5FH_10725 [Candidatus Zixiibacteriota bacterium]
MKSLIVMVGSLFKLNDFPQAKWMQFKPIWRYKHLRRVIHNPGRD